MSNGILPLRPILIKESTCTAIIEDYNDVEVIKTFLSIDCTGALTCHHFYAQFIQLIIKSPVIGHDRYNYKKNYLQKNKIDL